MKFKVVKNIIIKGKLVEAGKTVDLDTDANTESLLKSGHLVDPKAKAEKKEEEPAK
jgi:hypothetical protein